MGRFKINDANKFTFLQVPKELILNKCYRCKLTSDTKLIYGLLIDRMHLSAKHKWCNAEKEIYLVYTKEIVSEVLGIGLRTVYNSFKILEDCNLISQERQGLNRANKIYVCDFSPEFTLNCKECEPKNVIGIHARDACTDMSLVACTEMQEMQANNNDINNNDINKKSTKQEPTVPCMPTSKLFKTIVTNINSKETLNILVKSVVDHMNMRLGKHLSYKSNTKVIENLVNKDSDVTLDKIKLVIDWKIYDWYSSYNSKSTFDGTKYLTFDTLLRPVNFNKYINEMDVGFKYPETWCSDYLVHIKNSAKSRDGLFVERTQKDIEDSIALNDKNKNLYMY